MVFIAPCYTCITWDDGILRDRAGSLPTYRF